jgi:hypothetical protein
VQAGLLSRENAFTSGRRRCPHVSEGHTHIVVMEVVLRAIHLHSTDPHVMAARTV